MAFLILLSERGWKFKKDFKNCGMLVTFREETSTVCCI
jgi:hypothetical protein